MARAGVHTAQVAICNLLQISHGWDREGVTRKPEPLRQGEAIAAIIELHFLQAYDVGDALPQLRQQAWLTHIPGQDLISRLCPLEGRKSLDATSACVERPHVERRE